MKNTSTILSAFAGIAAATRLSAQSACYGWNSQYWSGPEPAYPVWTECGREICVPCGTTEQICYDLSNGQGVEVECKDTWPTYEWNDIEWIGEGSSGQHWTPCGNRNCMKADTLETQCYDVSQDVIIIIITPRIDRRHTI